MTMNNNKKNSKKKKGFLMLETAAALGIISLFVSMTAPVVKNSIEIKNTAVNEARYGRNFLFIMENINRELDSAYEINILSGGEKGEALYKIYQEGKVKDKKIIYYFSDRELRRYTSTDMEEQKDDIVLENVSGKFFRENDFVKLKIMYKNREEEYVYKQK